MDILRRPPSRRRLSTVGEFGNGLDWDDATAMLSALMRIDARLDALEAKLGEIERLLDGDDEEEEEGNG